MQRKIDQGWTSRLGIDCTGQGARRKGPGGGKGQNLFVFTSG